MLLVGNSIKSCLQPFCRRLARRSQRGDDCAMVCGTGTESGVMMDGLPKPKPLLTSRSWSHKFVSWHS